MQIKCNDKTWQALLTHESKQPYFKNTANFLAKQIQLGKTIYPANELIFNAFNLTPYDKVQVVIIGQDPYHGPGQAMGLSFSVPEGLKLPPSLRNIFKERKNDLAMPISDNGSLIHWAKQGVLLLNATLTVEAGKPQSHSKSGWSEFTDNIIRGLNQHPNFIVFLLWGGHAQKKASLIDTSRHAILTAAHPSPLSAHRGFLGCQHFSRCNKLLVEHGQTAINW